MLPRCSEWWLFGQLPNCMSGMRRHATLCPNNQFPLSHAKLSCPAAKAHPQLSKPDQAIESGALCARPSSALMSSTRDADLVSFNPRGGFSGAFMVASSGARSRRSSSGKSTSSSSMSSSVRKSALKPLQSVRLLSRLFARLVAPCSPERAKKSTCPSLLLD